MIIQSHYDALNFLKNPDQVHVMVDIETLALTPDAAITEIGAVLIATEKDYFQINLSYHAECCDPYGNKENSTMHWRVANNLPWQGMPGNSDSTVSINTVLVSFFGWLREVSKNKELIMWCKGTNFDCTILTQKARFVGSPTPWQYNKFFDLRTLLNIYPQFKVPPESVKHNGLGDSIQQAKQLWDIAEHISALRKG